MARRKFKNNQRFEPTTERSFHEFMLSAPFQQTSRTELLRLVRGGEDSYLELKVRLSNTEKIAQEIIALANTDGGTIVFGVNDQLRIEGVDNPEGVRDELVRICNEEIIPPLLPLIDVIAFDSGRRVVALDIEGKRRPYRTKDGRFFRRVGAEKREVSREELSPWLDEIRPLGFENLPVIGAKETDIDDALLWSFLREFDGDAFESNKNLYNTGEILRRDLLLAVGNMNDFTPTVAALLLFGKNEKVGEFLPRSVVHLTRFAGENSSAPIVETLTLQGNLHTLYEASLRFIKRYCDLWSDKNGFSPRRNGNSPVKARANYKIETITEAIANLLTHRDLAVKDVLTRISVFDQAIEFSNPRRTNGFATPSLNAIRYGIPNRLNPQTSAIFSLAAYGTNSTKGNLPNVLRESRLFTNKKPEIYASNDEFKLRIYGV